MIITKTPFRMSFFGGGTDVESFFKKYGGAVISTTIDKYCYVSVRKLLQFAEYKSEISYSVIERVKEYSEIENPLIRNALQHFNIDGVRLTYDADLPARSGLGTSSSFAVGLLNALHRLKGGNVNRRQLATESIILERELCKEAGGWQDQIAAAYGGFNRIVFDSNGYTVEPIIMQRNRKEKLCNNIAMFFTGFTRFSDDIHRSNICEESAKNTILIKMLELVDKAHTILIDDSMELDDFGYLLDYSWKLKRSCGSNVSTKYIDELYRRGLNAGAIGGKLLGAGGGGFLIFYVQPSKREKLLSAMKDLKYVPFQFENDGTKIIYSSD